MLVSRRIMVAKFPYFLWALRLALIVLCAFIAFVSLMPFNWTFDALTGQAVAVFFDINPFQPHTGRVGLALDAGLNALLFAPLGFGLWVNDRRAPMRVLGLGRMLVLAVVYGTALQALQLFLPRRNAALSDAEWNGVGLLAGAAMAWLLWKAWHEIRSARARCPVT